MLLRLVLHSAIKQSSHIDRTAGIGVHHPTQLKFYLLKQWNFWSVFNKAYNICTPTDFFPLKYGLDIFPEYIYWKLKYEYNESVLCQGIHLRIFILLLVFSSFHSTSERFSLQVHLCLYLLVTIGFYFLDFGYYWWNSFFLFFFLFYFQATGIWTLGLMLARQALYHLSISASCSLCWVLLRWGLVNYVPVLATNCDPSDLCLLWG
jgi:hypothetical protein